MDLGVGGQAEFQASQGCIINCFKTKQPLKCQTARYVGRVPGWGLSSEPVGSDTVCRCTDRTEVRDSSCWLLLQHCLFVGRKKNPYLFCVDFCVIEMREKTFLPSILNPQYLR